MLDPNLAALLTVPVSYWAKSETTDEWGGENSGYSAFAKTLYCYPSLGAQMVQRPDGTVYTSEQSLIFDANDETVQGFQLGDRFQAVGIAGGQVMQAQGISGTYSPGPSFGEPMSQWLVEVYL